MSADEKLLDIITNPPTDIYHMQTPDERRIITQKLMERLSENNDEKIEV